MDDNESRKLDLAGNASPAPAGGAENGFLTSLVAREGGISVGYRDGVGVLCLDRPAKLNVMGRTFWPAMREILQEMQADPNCRCILITGTGRAFSAGGDIASFQELHTDEQRLAFQNDCMATFAALERCSLPVIAAVNGLAFGGGCELAMACDIVIAADDAIFSVPEAELGLVPGYGALKGPRTIGRQWTNWMIMTAAPVTASEALAIGLVQKIVSAAGLLDEALKISEGIARRPAAAIAAAKCLTSAHLGDADFNRSTDMIGALHGCPEGQARRASFLRERSTRR